MSTTTANPASQEKIEESKSTEEASKNSENTCGLVVCSRVKARFKALGCQSRPETIQGLDEVVDKFIEATCQSAKANKRKTARASDVPPVLAATALASDEMGYDENVSKAYSSACVDIAVKAHARARSNKRQKMTVNDV